MSRLGLIVAALAGSTSAAIAQEGAFTLLEEVIAASDVSADGSRIIGFDLFTGQGWLYTDGVPQSLGAVSSMAAISGHGSTVVGEIFEGDLEYAGRWREGTGWENLGDLGLGGCDFNRSAAFGTNHDGSIIVGLGWEGCKGRAFLWTQAFTSADEAADCDASGSLDILDFVCFQNAFTAGCN